MYQNHKNIRLWYERISEYIQRKQIVLVFRCQVKYTWKVFAVSDIVWNQLKIKIREKVGDHDLGEEDKGVDAGAVGLVHRDRDVQEAVPAPHLVNKRLWPTMIFPPGYFAWISHLDILNIPPRNFEYLTWIFCRLSLLNSLLSLFASWSQKSPELLVVFS